MGAKSYLGEFEHMVLLAILQLDPEAYGPELAALLEEQAGREVSRGALYSSLDRLERKGYLTWRIDPHERSPRGHAKRRFSVSDEGLEALRSNRETLLRLWSGLERVLSRADSR